MVLSAVVVSAFLVLPALTPTIPTALGEETVKCAKCEFANPKTVGGKDVTQCQKCGYSLKSFAADKGPDKIDPAVMGTYPKAMQETYERGFAKRCSKCHTLARAINTDNPPTKWEEYIKKMMRKPGSGITKEDAKRIWEFLVFDTAKRKGAFLEKLPDPEKEAAKKVVSEAGN